jgi:phospholipase A1
MDDVAVVFVPGIIGTEITYKSELIWPGEPWELIVPYTRMAQLTSPIAVERNIIKQYTPFYSIYNKILDHLNAVLPGRIFECPYDWRLPNEESAKKLADKVSEASQSHSKIVIVAHSMGGLVARHYLESGQFENTSGYRNVSALFTLATPHYGSPFALAAALGYRKEEFLSKDQVCDLASRPEFPSVYQLLPPPGIPFVWRTDTTLDSLDIYGSQGTAILGARGQQLKQPNLDAALKFWQAFKGPAKVRYFCFLGTQYRMINSVSVSVSNGQMQASMPDEIACSGDGTVPSWSAILAHRQSLAVGGDHVGMMGDSDLHDTLDSLLGLHPTRLMQAPPVTISLRQRVVETGSRFVALVRFLTQKANGIAKGSIHIEPNAELSLQRAKPALSVQVEMTLQRSMCLEFELEAPKVPSVYRVTWSEEDRVIATANLIVQSTERLSEAEMQELRTMSEKLRLE